MTATAQQIEHSAVSDVYAFLSRMWLNEVGADVAGELQNRAVRIAYASLGGFVPENFDLDDLAEQYCRLFIGPRGHLPLLQSVWIDGQLQGEAIDSVQSFAELFGYDLQQLEGGVMLDHFGVQLSVMSTAISLTDPKQEAVELRKAIGVFYRRHLCWPDRLLQSLINREDSPFYSSLAQVTSSFLQLERPRWADS